MAMTEGRASVHPFTQAVLDRMGCDSPDCGHDHTVLFLRANCHPKAGLEVRYLKAFGCVVCACSQCHTEVAAFAVAAGAAGEVGHG